jgi:dihydrodipicolinate synthase/N-acetylneuraminate lyase
MESTDPGGYPLPPFHIQQTLKTGLFIPAHPLALTNQRKFNERRQQALTRYYLDAGVGGIAIGVHTTQFEIHDPRVGLYFPVLRLAAETISAWELTHGRTIVRIAGICGETDQAAAEARLAAKLGYHAGLLSMGALRHQPPQTLLSHARRVAREIPLFGFYLQPAVGGMILPYDFWREFAEIPNVIAIKIAPFNRYQTFDVLRAVAESGRANEIALYTGNDDHIVLDLLSSTQIQTASGVRTITIAGGLLGHWACWTKKAVEIFQQIQKDRGSPVISRQWLELAWKITDCNAAFFDAANQFKGVLCGIHEVLRRQGLLENNYCLDENERLSPGQSEEIDRVYQSYPDLSDDRFVQANLQRWLDAV